MSARDETPPAWPPCGLPFGPVYEPWKPGDGMPRVRHYTVSCEDCAGTGEVDVAGDDAGAVMCCRRCAGTTRVAITEGPAGSAAEYTDAHRAALSEAITLALIARPEWHRYHDAVAGLRTVARLLGVQAPGV